MEINSLSKIKRIQFLGSPFRGKHVQELKERVKQQQQEEGEWEVLVRLPQEDQK